MYSQIAKFYRDMAGSRGHFENQVSVLNDIIYSVLDSKNTSLRMLDLACGTGDVPHIISKNNPNFKVYGCDSSPEMLKQADLLENSKVTFFQADWNNASSIFDKYGKFDVVWIMGNSIAHWPIEKLSSLFTIIAENGLCSEGAFICDMRSWQEENGVVVDHGRSGDWRELGQYRSSDGIEVLCKDKVSYANEQQKVKYKLTPIGDLEEIIFDLAYNIFSSSQLETALESVGFKVSEYTVPNEISYPYRIFVGRSV